MFVVIFVGLIFLLCSIFMAKYMSYYKTHGTTIKATCYGYEIIKKIRANKGDTNIKVLLKYHFNGEEIISSLGLWSQQFKYKIGQSIPIYVLMGKGPEYIAMESNTYKLAQYLFGIMGIGGITWGIYLVSSLKSLNTINRIEILFCVFGIIVLYKVYKKIKPGLHNKVLKSATIETKETLSDPKRKLILNSDDLSTKNLFHYKIGLLITMIFFLGLNGLIYSLWNKEPDKLKETIISSIKNMNYEYFIAELQDQNPVFYILSFLLLMNIFMLISLFIQLRSRPNNEF